MKVQYDKIIQPRSFDEGDMVLTYDQKHDKLGEGKLESMWHGPYIVSLVLEKKSYELVDYDEIPLGGPRNGLYLKIYYAQVIQHGVFVNIVYNLLCVLSFERGVFCVI